MSGKKKSGNVKVPATGKDSYPAPKVILAQGDIVRMTAEALKSSKWMTTSPRTLIAGGWPNEFHVETAFEHKVDGLCVQLQECCFRRVNQKGDYFCGGHPMGLFEKLTGDSSFEREFQPGDSRASVTVPFLGELVGYEYRADEKKAVFRVGGQKMEAEGGLADFLNGIVKKHGVV